MKALILTSLINMGVDCSTLMDNSVAEPEKWKLNVCMKLSKDYEALVLTPLSSVYKKVDIEKIGDLDNVIASPPIAGRLKIKRFIHAGGVVQQVTTNYSLQAYKDIWVFRKKVRAGELINNFDIHKRKVNVAPFIGLRKFEVLNPIGMTVVRSVAKGELLYEEILAKPVLIKVNDALTVVIHAGSLKIKTIGVALENGADLYDEIKVRIIDTGAVVSGKIIGKKDVYVQI